MFGVKIIFRGHCFLLEKWYGIDYTGEPGQKKVLVKDNIFHHLKVILPNSNNSALMKLKKSPFWNKSLSILAQKAQFWSFPRHVVCIG